MIKFLICSVLTTLCFTACIGVKTLEGSVRRVYFTADSGIFADTVFPYRTLVYPSLFGLRGTGGQVVALQKEAVAEGFIRKPTFFTADGTDFLVFPGEHILVSGDSEQVRFSVVGGNAVRNNELTLLQRFKELEQRPKMTYLTDYTLQSVLDLELVLHDRRRTAEAFSQKLLDSLYRVYAVSERFRELTKDYVKGRYHLSMLGVYQVYRDTLLAHQLYRSKVASLLPEVNNITDATQFTPAKERFTNSLYAVLFPSKGIHSRVKDEEGFRALFDTVAVTFDGIARDYLLSRIVFRAVEKGIVIPGSYWKKYRRFSIYKDYRRIIKRAGREQKKIRKSYKVVPAELLLADGKNSMPYEAVLAQHRGKYILVDLWASWCIPCKREMPHLSRLAKTYPKNKVVFLSISVDQSSYGWHGGLREMDRENLEHYQLLHFGKTVLEKELNLTTIPRYLLYDKEGKLVNADAPWPSNPELTVLLDSYLKTF